MHTWEHKVAIVTGGGSGIGRALCLAMARRGVRVLVTDINLAAAQLVAAECGATATSTQLDVTNADAVQTCITHHAQQQGRLDWLFNNAGIGVGGESHEIPLAAWKHVIDINVHGVLHGVLAAYPLMIKQGFGHIINTASLAGLGPAPLLTPYAVSKHAVVGLSTSLRIEAASKGVQVSVLCPSAIETPILDSENPPEYAIPWTPNLRKFLTALAGPPYSADKCAEETLHAIARNVPVIVLPARARMAWRVGRLFPALVEKITRGAVATARTERT